QRRCSVIHQRPRDLGEWENVNCSAKLGFLCQAAALVVPQPANTGLSLLFNRGRCLPEFFEYNRRCYRLLTQLSDAGRNNLDGANCQTRIAPHSPEELVLMRLMMRTASSLPEFSWIGVNFSYNSTLGPTKSKIQFNVEDGLPVTLGAALNFYDDQLIQTPKGYANSANYCVAVGREVAGLSLMNCSAQLPSICGYSMHDYELRPTTTSTSCPSTWKRLGDVCYSDFRYPPRTWSDAESNCQSLNPKAHLVSLHTPTQQSYLSRLLQHRRAWLGLRVQLQSNANRTRIYTWSDESPVDYLSFGVGEPSFGMSNGDVEECVILQDDTHDWNDVHCYDRYPFVCQLTLSSSVDQTSVSTTPIPQDLLQRVCSKDDLSFCVELHQTPLTFWDAETMCQSRNLTLVTVPSKGHHKFVMTLLPEHESAFIGLFASNGQWLWTSAYPSLSATFWSKNHPFGKDLCVFVEKGEDELYTWKAGPCDQPMPYFCATRPTLPVLKSIDLTKYTCPSNYTRIGPSCYLVKAGLEDKSTWTEALNLCALTASGAGLATISSIQEQNELIALLGLQFKSAWIGLQLVDGVHTWQRGDPVIYTNWARDQPSGHGMRCTLLQYRFDHLGEWNDEECYQRHGYVCQVAPLPTSTTTGSPPSRLFKTGLCVSGYYEYRNQCFSVLPYIPQSQRSASELHDEVSGQCARMTHATGTNCADKQNNWWGTLTCPVVASPHTVADAAFVRALLGTFGMSVKNAWIGLKLVSNKTTVQVVSEDGVTLGASHLLASKPQLLSVDIVSNITVAFHCLTISTLSNNLEVVDCSMTGLPAICSYYLADHPLHPKTRAFHTTNCPSGWTPFGGKCFSVTSVNTQLNWSDAEQTCQASGKDVPVSRDFQLIGHLASIHSLEEQHVVYEMASSSSIWIGLQAFYAPVLAHSLTAVHSESITSSVQLAWSDDSSVDYLALSSTHAYLDVSPSMCFAIVNGDGSSWQATECHQQRSFVCQLSPMDPMDTLVSRSANPVQNDGAPQPCNPDVPLAMRSNSACYRLFFSMVDWAGAEGTCRNLGPDVHLASIHSKSEFDELIELLRNHGVGSQDIWFGLHESEFAYAWSDGTSTDFISLSADLSKDHRHLRQDCFVLSPSPANRSTMNWKAVDCAGPRPALICQRGGRVHTPLATIPDPSNWKLVLCPPGYRQFADRCFSLLPKLLSWNDANNECSLNAKQFRGYFGSLARIDSSFVQDFVASLLDDLTAPSSSAWIGLQRDFSEGTPNIRWADTSQTRYLRPIFRTHQEPIYNLKSIRSIQADEIHLKMCTAVYRSTLPRLNGLWLQWACDQIILLPSICQAIPPDGMNLDDAGLTPVSASCPSEFFLGTTGFANSRSSSANTVQPVCYRLLSQTEKLDWQTSSRRCQALSSRQNNVSLLSIASVFEASFLRSWLRLPRALGGAGLSADQPVWSALSVSEDCPKCFWNWTWDTIDFEPVRYTDWLVSPSPNPSGCYVFEPTPYKRGDFKADQGLGSLRPAASCAHTYFTVCQTLTKPTDSRVDLNLAVTASHREPTTHQPARQQCFNFLNTHAADYYLENVTVSRDGKPCIRYVILCVHLY
ncbi:Lectin C-type domain protein, partial [Paragonimus heterotremus]